MATPVLFSRYILNCMLPCMPSTGNISHPNCLLTTVRWGVALDVWLPFEHCIDNGKHHNDTNTRLIEGTCSSSILSCRKFLCISHTHMRCSSITNTPKPRKMAAKRHMHVHMAIALSCKIGWAAAADSLSWWWPHYMESITIICCQMWSSFISAVLIATLINLINAAISYCYSDLLMLSITTGLTSPFTLSYSYWFKPNSYPRNATDAAQKVKISRSELEAGKTVICSSCSS